MLNRNGIIVRVCVCVGLGLSVAVMSEVSMVSIWWGESCMPLSLQMGSDSSTASIRIEACWVLAFLLLRSFAQISGKLT